MESSANRRSSRGFTLVELMVVVVIAAILLAVGVPSYSNYVRQARRTDARTAVLDLAGREERYFSTNAAAYSPLPANLGYGGGGWPIVVGSGYYQVTVCSPANANCAAGLNMPNPPAAPSFTVVAQSIGTQVKDVPCSLFAVDSTGQQYAVSGAGAANTAFCWSN
ncbi:MAG TPA: type IV pilin protein [Steroidobacteraceae bacterium]|jgi:type IV pilus assembly protein PilE|nr:type IV pilin protein [Steroidobacteraceae bacterium]